MDDIQGEVDVGKKHVFTSHQLPRKLYLNFTLMIFPSIQHKYK